MSQDEILIKGVSMNLETLKQFENLFLELKKSTMEEIKLHSEVVAPIKGDEMDQGNLDRDLALNLKLASRNSFMLKKIDNALFKIKNGTFGVCEECDSDIDLIRLRARPTANECIACKEAMEQNESHVLYAKRSHTHGQTFASNVLPLRRNNEETLLTVIVN
jgi:DnaK suppressor protein